MECHGRLWKVMEDQGMSWKVIEGLFLSSDCHFKWEKLWVVLSSRLCWFVLSALLVACRIIVTAPVQFRLWLGLLGLWLDWIWDLGIGLGLVNSKKLKFALSSVPGLVWVLHPACPDLDSVFPLLVLGWRKTPGPRSSHYQGVLISSGFSTIPTRTICNVIA